MEILNENLSTIYGGKKYHSVRDGACAAVGGVIGGVAGGFATSESGGWGAIVGAHTGAAALMYECNKL